jgi:hypothetical protein
MKIRQLLLVPALALMVACSGKTPDCASSDTTKLLSQALATKFKEMGVGAQDLEKLIKINGIQVVSRDEKLDTYTCQANFSIEKPAGLAEKLYNATSAEGGFDKLSNALIDKYGMGNGGAIFGSMMGSFSGGLGMDFMRLTIGGNIPPEEKAAAQQKLKALIDEIASPYPIPVGYEVFQVKNDGKLTPSLRWQANNDGLFELSSMLYKVNEVLK